MIQIDPSSMTSKAFTITPADSTNPRNDLLVIRYKSTGDTPIPKPSDPLQTVFLNIHDDFELAVIPGTAAGVPAYPAKEEFDVILAGLRVPSGATHGNQVTVDLGIREIALPAKALYPVFKLETPTGVVDGTNKDYELSAAPLAPESLMVIVDSILRSPAEYTLAGTTLTMVDPLVPGQDIYVRYLASSPNGQNPISQVVETPSGATNGSNPNFVLTGRPAARSSVIVFIDGTVVKPAGWTLIEGPSQYSIQFGLGYIPQPGQSVDVAYLVNASTIGAAGSGNSGGSGGSTASGFAVYGSVGSPNTISANSGVSVTSEPRQYQYVKGPTAQGETIVTASPQVGVGSTIGQELVLRGTSDSDYPRVQDGDGLSLNGPCNLTSKQTLVLTWNGTLWDEVSRRM